MHEKTREKKEQLFKWGVWLAVIIFSLAWGYTTASAQTKVFKSLYVAGPIEVNESTTTQYRAILTFTDGTYQDVSSTATWGLYPQSGSISTRGAYTAPAVTSNQSVSITASYTYAGSPKGTFLNVLVKDSTTTTPTLQSISIGGPTSVNESTATTFPVTATMTNGTTKAVTAVWTESSQYAAFNGNVLTATAVTGNQVVNATASYTEGGITRTASKSITILDSVVPTPVGSHAGRFTTYQGATTCLPCHRAQATAVHASEHYQWKGKFGAINDFCIYPDINLIGKLTNVNGIEVDGGCLKCHAGLGAKPVATTAPTDAQLGNIDCLVCHAPKYKRMVDPVTKTKFVPDEAAMGMTILEAAVDIRPTTRDTCLNCHTKSGGGNNFKRGDIEEHHRAPTTRAFDVHMSPASLSGGDMHCTTCHTVTSHKIAGKGSDLRIQEGTKPDCASCHTATPHVATATVTSANATKLNTHAKRINCTTCHIPTFAKNAPTDMFRDWSAHGELNLTTGLYDPVRTMLSNVVPQYKWWNGIDSVFYNFGTAATPQTNGKVLMAGPAAATIATSGAKIYPFKVHTAKQPIEMTATKRLLPLKIGSFYTTGDIASAISQGQTGVGWPQNAYTFQDTERWMSIFHEVAPKEQAIGYQNCNACHNTTTPKVPLKALGYVKKASMTVAQVCSQCHGGQTYSFSTAHGSRHSGYDCNRCHDFSKAP